MAGAVQIGGALLVLAAFVLLQRGLVTTRSPVYLVLNLAGGGVLAASALAGRQWGFVLLQTAWALVALAGLALLAAGARAA